MSHLFKLGFRGYHATVIEYIGEVKVHIRKYIDEEGRKNIPTKFGVALTVQEFEDLKKAMKDLSEMVDVMNDTNSMTTQPGDELEQILTPPSEQSKETIQETPKTVQYSQTVNKLRRPRKKVSMKNNKKLYYMQNI